MSFDQGESGVLIVVTVKYPGQSIKVYFQTSKSIFKTPQGNNGMVGVGTNGHGDRGMTENRESARYNARHLAPNQ